MGNPLKGRLFDNKIKRPRVLIICEGEKTEVNYFKSFEKDTDLLLTVEVDGIGRDPKNLQKNARSRKREAEKKGDPFESIWIVFDRDQFTKINFLSTIKEANKDGIKPIYSVEAFELWYLLHFDYVNTAIDRKQYKDMLSEKLQLEFKKNDIYTYDQIKDRMPKAIENAERLHKSYNPSPKPFEDNPCTTVYELVTHLLKPELKT